MAVILHPFNEHIEHLYLKQAEITRALCEANESVDKKCERLSGYEAELALQDAKHGRLEKELKALQTELKELDAGCRLEACEAEDRTNKKARIDMDERLDRTRSDLEALRPLLDESNAALHRVELATWRTSSLSERFDRDMIELRKELDSWNNRLLGLSRGVEQITNAHANTQRSTVKLTADLDSHRNEAQSEVLALKARVQGTETACKTSSSALFDLEEKAKLTSKALGEMTEQVVEFKEELQHLEEENKLQDEALLKNEQQDEKARAEDAKKQMTVLDRMKEMESGFAKLKQMLDKEVERDMPGAVRDLTVIVDQHSGSITQHAAAFRSLEVSQSRWQEQLQNMEIRNSECETVQADLVKRADLARVDISELLSSSKSTEGRIETQHAELEKVQALTLTTRHALGQTNAAVQHLHGDLGTAKGGLANTAMRLDLAHEYITGVSRGLQETHKLGESGQDGVLPTKHGHDRTRPLPMIGVSGRPASEQTSARCVSSSRCSTSAST